MAVTQETLGHGQQPKDKKSPLISRRTLLLGGGAAGIIAVADRLGLLPPIKENTPNNSGSAQQTPETPTPDASPTINKVTPTMDATTPPTEVVPTVKSETPTVASSPDTSYEPNPVVEVDREIHDYVPETTPIENVIDKIPYPLHSTYTLAKANGDLQYFDSFTFGVAESMFAPLTCGVGFGANGVCPNVDTIEPNPAAFPDLPEAEALKKIGANLEEAYMITYLNMLQTQDPTLYGNYTLETVKELAAKGETPKLSLPRANTTGFLKDDAPVEVDMFNKPLFIIAVGRDQAELNTVQNINYDLRGIDGSLILETYKADGYYAGDSAAQQISINKELRHLLCLLPDYEAQRLEHEGDGAKINQDRFKAQKDMFDGKEIESKLIPYKNGNDWRGVLKVTSQFQF